MGVDPLGLEKYSQEQANKVLKYFYPLVKYKQPLSSQCINICEIMMKKISKGDKPIKTLGKLMSPVTKPGFGKIISSIASTLGIGEKDEFNTGYGMGVKNIVASNHKSAVELTCHKE